MKVSPRSTHPTHLIQPKKMSPLKDLKNTQIFFQNLIEESPFNPSYSKPTLAPSIQTQKRIQKEKKKKFNSLIKPLKKINLKNAKEIYRRNYLETLKNALEDHFPISSYFLKDQNFKKLAFQYILKNKACSPFFSDYGKKFPNFIRKSPFHLPFPFLADLASFEWKLKELTLTPFEKPILNQKKNSIINLPRSPSDSILNQNSKLIKKTVQYLKRFGDHALFKISQNIQLFSSSLPVIDLWKILTHEMKLKRKNKSEKKNHFELKMMQLKKNQKILSQKKLKMNGHNEHMNWKKDLKHLKQNPFETHFSSKSLIQKKNQKKEFFILIKKDFENKILIEKINVYDYFILESFLNFDSISRIQNRILKRFLIQSKKTTKKNSKELLVQKKDLISSYGKSLNLLIQRGFLIHKEF